MQTILSRFEKLLLPFNCSFATYSPDPRLLKAPPELPHEIWLEIFQFATYVHRSATIAPLDPFTVKRISRNVMGLNTESYAMRTKLSLVLVCRLWRQVAIQMLYDHVVIKSPARATAILAALQASALSSESGLVRADRAGHGQWTRHIEIYTHARGANKLHFLQIVFRILHCCPNLRELSGTWSHDLPIEFLAGISKLFGPSLRGLYWNERRLESPSPHYTQATPEFIASFRSLRVLDLRNFVGSDIYDRLEVCVGDCPIRPTLPCVEHLIISNHPRSLGVATLLSLPTLYNLTLKTLVDPAASYDFLNGFLKEHGSSLTVVDLPSPSHDTEFEPDTAHTRRTAQHINPEVFLQLNVCPNLVTLSFPVSSPPISAYVHTSLRRIGLRGVRADGLYPDKETTTKRHLTSISSALYPNLELVRTVGFLVEADTDALIKDIFIWWTEKFERQGIDFLDGEGVLWAYTDPIETIGSEIIGWTSTESAAAVGSSDKCDRRGLLDRKCE